MRPDNDEDTGDHEYCLQRDKKGLDKISLPAPKRRKKEWAPIFCPKEAKKAIGDWPISKYALSQDEIREKA